MRAKNVRAMECAGRLYKIAVDTTSDPVEKVFAILNLVQEAPLAETLELYRQIKNSWLTLAEIITAKPLTHSQKIQVEDYITTNMGSSICFLYDVDPKLLGGIKVRVGDNIFDESVMAKIRDLTIKGAGDDF